MIKETILNNKLVLALLSMLLVTLTVTGCSANVSYLDEFAYLPAVEGMEIEDYEEAEGDNFGNAIYKIEREDYEDFLANYEEILAEDGWEIVEDDKPEHLEATKDDHVARINVVDGEDELTILLWGK